MKTTFGINPRAAFWLLFAAGAAILAMTGCDSNTESGFATSEDTEEQVLAQPDPLNLLAIGVPEFGEEVSRQWAAERDGELKISHLSLDEFESAGDVSADIDLIVHNSSVSVDLISKNMIRAFPKKALMSEEMNPNGFLQHFRKALVRHGDKTWSVCLGGQQLRLFYRSDILEAAEISPPETWEELDRAIGKLENVDAAKGKVSIMVPTSGEMASHLFMARVASQIRDQGKLTAFFDRKTMKPTIDSLPFVTALESLKALASETGGKYSVSEVFEKFAAGEAVFAIAWPTTSDSIDTEKLESISANWGIARLPGSMKFYDLKESSWQKRGRGDDVRVDLLGTNANNVSIAGRTSNAKDASEFVAWLADKNNSQKLLSDVAAPFRTTHLARVGRWYGLDQADREFLDALADSIDETHQSKIFLMFPQLPGKRQYMKLMGSAISEFLDGNGADAKSLLELVSKDWETLTESLGRDNQVKELRRGNAI